ncbi:MAG: excinuclease ABC subunit UvrC, partial [Silvanigrellaceae bacterium]|nr:excinuclease ABC subunit UvrC [Silvanigrellaceae bacterium]
PFNILLRDDKAYPYIKIDLKENWPRVLVVRRRKNDDCLYFGPYTNSGYMYQLLAVINRFFPLVKCTPEVFKTVRRPCNYYDIKRCLGPCKLAVEKLEYQKHLDSVIGILKGHVKEITKKIKLDMLKASEDLRFEKAALLRDQIKAVEKIATPQSVNFDISIDIDIIAVAWENQFSCFYISCVRDGKLVRGESFILREILEEPNEDEEKNHLKRFQENSFSAFICQYYQSREIPEFILLEDTKDIFTSNKILELSLYLKDLKQLQNNFKSEKVQLYSIADSLLKNFKTLHDKGLLRKKLTDLSAITKENALNRLNEQIKIDESSQNFLRALQEFLELESLPLRIECFDISTFQGSQTVASQVVFREGKAAKKDYRKYIIKETIGKTDDFASLREVMRRRFKQESRDILPDALLIDGGEPQVREVAHVLKNLGLEHLALFGIAKARTQSDFSSTAVKGSLERIVIPYRDELGKLLPEVKPETKPLKEGSKEFKLVTQIRDEAHRFAITFHRKRRDKQGLKSILSEVKGIGPKRKKKLLEIYGNLSHIMDVPQDEIAEKTGIPLQSVLKLKQLICESLSNSKKE